MDDLKSLRDRIDVIDEEIVALFEERMEIVLKIAQYKKQNNLPVYNKDREKEVIEKSVMKLKNKNFENSLNEFITDLMKISKEEQNKLIKP